VKVIRAVILATATLALVVSPMLASDVEAQRRGGRRAASPRAGGVVVAAYYRPAFISPFYYDPSMTRGGIRIRAAGTVPMAMGTAVITMRKPPPSGCRSLLVRRRFTWTAITQAR
jgi:hypothetical protein